MSEPEVRGIEARIHGRYVFRAPEGPQPWPVLIGFHGYAEDATAHFDQLSQIPGSAEWMVVSVQGLHRFYTRQERVVASWMTRQDRELCIGDNIDYVGRVLGEIQRRYHVRPPLVFAGFSQGGAMAYRAAAHYESQALIVLGADVPPDVAAMRPVRLPPVLLGRGVNDHLYPESQHASDAAVLREMGVTVEPCTFDGGHEWTPAFRDAAADVLTRALSGL